jgi:hypothetical protein
VLKNSILSLLLGGAAVHRCDKALFSMPASAAEGNYRASRELFSKLKSQYSKQALYRSGEPLRPRR